MATTNEKPYGLSPEFNADEPYPADVIGLNPQSGGGVVIVSAIDDDGGYEALDLSSGQREKVAAGETPALVADENEPEG